LKTCRDILERDDFENDLSKDEDGSQLLSAEASGIHVHLQDEIGATQKSQDQGRERGWRIQLKSAALSSTEELLSENKRPRAESESADLQ